ncbi:hypothetical protein H7U40_18175 [Flavonifractor plautii]|uniref:hypothetical protein n=1 Tax=Flavonifractor plautii TaxID=292800 RepID=UPI00195C6A10|nr:hypothetical protein [Flavonifractor plautii]MBM6792176.1 hypothetical protein [Flavonifractor plautii]
MARAIDADELQELCNRRIQDTWNSGTAPVSWAAAYADFKDDIDSMPTLTPPNEPLTLEDAKKERYIWFTPLNDWAKVTPFGVLFFGSEELMNWETLCEEWGYRFKAYRRPPEVSP